MEQASCKTEQVMSFSLSFAVFICAVDAFDAANSTCDDAGFKR
jgi:hypothetical protein